MCCFVVRGEGSCGLLFHGGRTAQRRRELAASALHQFNQLKSSRDGRSILEVVDHVCRCRGFVSITSVEEESIGMAKRRRVGGREGRFEASYEVSSAI